MTRRFLLILAPLLLLAGGCANTPPPVGSPGYMPPTVRMPVGTSAREGPLLPLVEDALRRGGYEPVYRGGADLTLDFAIEEGPVNVDTRIGLLRGGRVVAMGQGRASGAPLINRGRVVEDSFHQALSVFESQLGRQTGMFR